MCQIQVERTVGFHGIVAVQRSDPPQKLLLFSLRATMWSHETELEHCNCRGRNFLTELFQNLLRAVLSDVVFVRFCPIFRFPEIEDRDSELKTEGKMPEHYRILLSYVWCTPVTVVALFISTIATFSIRKTENRKNRKNRTKNGCLNLLSFQVYAFRLHACQCS